MGHTHPAQLPLHAIPPLCAVKWEGYAEQTWEADGNVLDRAMVEAYDEEHPEATVPPSTASSAAASSSAATSSAAASSSNTSGGESGKGRLTAAAPEAGPPAANDAKPTATSKHARLAAKQQQALAMRQELKSEPTVVAKLSHFNCQKVWCRPDGHCLYYALGEVLGHMPANAARNFRSCKEKQCKHTDIDTSCKWAAIVATPACLRCGLCDGVADIAPHCCHWSPAGRASADKSTATCQPAMWQRQSRPCTKVGCICKRGGADGLWVPVPICRH